MPRRRCSTSAGTAGASINRILERAGATSGALYFHFTSKEGLARAVMQAQPRTIMPLLTSEGLQRLVDITMIWSHLLQTDTLLRAGCPPDDGAERVRHGGRRDSLPGVGGHHGGVPAHGRGAGELQAGVDPKELAELVVETCTGMQLFSAAASGRADLPQRAVRMWKLVLPGVAVPALVVRIVIDPEQGRAAVYGSLPAAGSMT